MHSHFTKNSAESNNKFESDAYSELLYRTSNVEVEGDFLRLSACSAVRKIRTVVLLAV